jgi:hypothetical protein
MRANRFAAANAIGVLANGQMLVAAALPLAGFGGTPFWYGHGRITFLNVAHRCKQRVNEPYVYWTQNEGSGSWGYYPSNFVSLQQLDNHEDYQADLHQSDTPEQDTKRALDRLVAK